MRGTVRLLLRRVTQTQTQTQTKTKDIIMTINTTPSLSSAIARHTTTLRPAKVLTATVRAPAPKAKATQLSARAYAERALREYLRAVKEHDVTSSIDWEV